MKRTALRMMMTLAVMAAGAVTASAQSLKAEIPFAFRSGSALMQPGTYRVGVTHLAGGPAMVYLENVESRRRVMATPYVTSEVTGSAAANTALTFQCADHECRLKQVSTGNAALYEFATPKAAGAHVATIALRPASAE